MFQFMFQTFFVTIVSMILYFYGHSNAGEDDFAT